VFLFPATSFSNCLTLPPVTSSTYKNSLPEELFFSFNFLLYTINKKHHTNERYNQSQKYSPILPIYVLARAISILLPALSRPRLHFTSTRFLNLQPLIPRLAPLAHLPSHREWGNCVPYPGMRESSRLEVEREGGKGVYVCYSCVEGRECVESGIV